MKQLRRCPLWNASQAKRLFCLAVVLAACGRQNNAQSAGSVTVRVSDVRDESPIDQAEVKLLTFAHMNASYWSFTDGGGRVSFDSVQHGTYRIEAKKNGYDLGVEQIDVAPRQNQNISVHLQPSAARNPSPVAASGTVSAASATLPPGAQKEFDAGRTLVNSDPAQSISHLRNAVKEYPKFAEAYFMMALAFLKLGEADSAIKSADDAIKVDPKLSKAHALRGRLLLEKRDFKESERALNESLRLDSQMWDAHFELARCYYNTGRMVEAEQQARAARELPGSSPATYLLLADIYIKLKQQAKAVLELRNFVEAQPDSPLVPRVREKIAALGAEKN